MDLMFDGDSFQEEITNKKEASAAYQYFVNNLSGFRNQLSSEGVPYEEAEKTVRQCWINLLKSSERVGYTNSHLERISKAFGLGKDKEKQEK